MLMLALIATLKVSRWA